MTKYNFVPFSSGGDTEIREQLELVDEVEEQTGDEAED